MKIFQKVKDGNERKIFLFGKKVWHYTKENKSQTAWKFKQIGTLSQVASDCKIYHPENCTIGHNSRIGEGALIEAIGGLIIGNNCILAPHVTIWTSNHNYYCPQKLPYDETIIFKAVTIEDNVWVGAEVKILPGITIHEGAVVGMGSVVTKDVPEGAVVGGNPAKVLKLRDMEQYHKLCEEKAFYTFSKHK